MKNLFAIVSFFLVSLNAFTQSKDSVSRHFKPFKVDVSLGYAHPSGSSNGTNFNGGVLFAVEPKYAIMDQLSLGLRIEAAVTAHVNTNGNNGSKDNAKANLSYLATGDYYFNNSGFRPFVGAGAGIYTTASADNTTTSGNISTIPSTSQFGFMARAGFEAGHFRLGIEYNFVANDASYLGAKFGVCIGGGRLSK